MSVTTKPGMDTGRTILVYVEIMAAPSTLEASTISEGTAVA